MASNRNRSRSARRRAAEDEGRGPGLSWRQLALVFGLSVVPRLIWASWAYVSPVSDMREYDTLATRWLETGRFGAEGFLAWRTPGYPAVLAGIYGLVGHHPRAAMMLHALLGGVSSVLIALLAARLISPRAGVLAGALHALSVTSILYVPLLLTEHLAVPLLVGALLCLALVSAGRRPIAWAGLSGLLFGLAILVRPACALFLPGALAVAGYDFPARRWRLPPAAAWLMAITLTLTPWVVRNIRVGAGPTLSSSDSYILYAGTQSEEASKWRHEKLWDTFPTEAERGPIWKQAAWNWISRNPGSYLRRCGEHFWKLLGPRGDGFVSYWAWPTVENDRLIVSYWRSMPIPGERAQPVPEEIVARAKALHAGNARLLSWTRALALPIIWLSMLLALRRWRQLAVVAVPTFTYLILVIVTYVEFRLREMAGPGVVVMMAALADAAATAAGKRG